MSLHYNDILQHCERHLFSSAVPGCLAVENEIYYTEERIYYQEIHGLGFKIIVLFNMWPLDHCYMTEFVLKQRKMFQDMGLGFGM